MKENIKKYNIQKISFLQEFLLQRKSKKKEEEMKCKIQKILTNYLFNKKINNYKNSNKIQSKQIFK